MHISSCFKLKLLSVRLKIVSFYQKQNEYSTQLHLSALVEQDIISEVVLRWYFVKTYSAQF